MAIEKENSLVSIKKVTRYSVFDDTNLKPEECYNQQKQHFYVNSCQLMC